MSPSRTAPPRIGLALAGGGFMGAAYELGALAALSESIDGLDLTELDVYVGVSAGGFLAAGLANGLSPHAMVRLFVETEASDTPLDPAALIRPAWAEIGRRIAQAPAFAAEVATEIRRGLIHGGVGTAAWRALDLATSLLPAGVIDVAPAEASIARLLSSDGRTDRFDALPTVLRVVATDIDRGDTVAFGAPGWTDVPISRAVVASAAVPGLVPPVPIAGRWFVDGALNKTMHASIALQEGASLVLCLNPLVPYAAGPHGPPAAIARRGLGAVLSQTVRTAIRSRMAVGLEKYRVTHPHADVILFEPRADDATIFFTRIFSVSSRRRLCEHAYRATREDLLARADRLGPVLARHGLRLNVQRLADPGHALVRSPERAPRRDTGLSRAALRLEHALEDLERVVRLSRAGER
jgi:predicted acylesterase/phospholipase RssA